jgi:hypothetical protein
MRIFLLSIACLISVVASGQSTMDSIMLGGRKAYYIYPTTFTPGAKYPFLLEFPPQTEDASHGNLVLLKNSGVPKLVNAGANIYPINPTTGKRDTFIVVKFQPADYNDVKFADVVEVIFDSCLRRFPIDTTKDVNGFYNYIGVDGIEHGADAIFNTLTWTLAGGVGSVNPVNFKKVKKIVTSDLQNGDNNGASQSKTPAIYATFSNKVLFWWQRTSGNSVPQATKDSIAKYATGITNSLRNTGAFTQTQTNDTMQSPYGAYILYNQYRLLLDDTGTVPPPNYALKPVFYIDFSGYTVRDPNHPENGFDAYPYIDPKNDITSFTTANAAYGIKTDTTFFFPDKSYSGYFPNGFNDNTFYPPGIDVPGNSAGGRGCRVILDFVGNTNWEDTSKQIVFTDIYAYNQTFNDNAKVYLYKMDTLFKIASRTQRALMLARPDSLMHPFDSLTTTSTPGVWLSKTFATPVTARYIMFRTVLNGSGKKAEFAEYVMYGARNFDSAANAVSVRPQIYTGALPSKKNVNYAFGKLNGSNYLNGIDTLQMANTGASRMYTGESYMDTTNNPVWTHFYFWTSPDVGPLQLGNAKRTGKFRWYTNLGASAYQSNTFGNSGWNIDYRFQEPEQMVSYNRASNFQFNFTAKYGSVPVSSTLTQWVGDGGYPNGLNLVPTIEVGNEVWAHGGSDMADFCMTRRCWDSIKAADPSMPVMLAGTETLDTAKIQLFSFLSYVLTADHVFPGDIINYHKYYSNRDYLPIGQTFDYNLQVGMRSETPEAWMQRGMLAVNERVARRTYAFLAGDTSKRIVLTEAGQGNWGHAATSVGEASLPWDVYCTPGVPGAWDSLQFKAIQKMRFEIIYPFVPGFWFYNDYAMMNNFGDPNNYPNLFSSYGSASDRAGSPPFNLRLFFPLWNYREAIYSRLKDYYPDSVYVNGDTTSLWHVRYRKYNATDSTCDIYWIGSRSGRTLTSSTVSIGTKVGNSVQKLLPSFTSTTPTLSTVTVTSGNITQNFNESPVLYFGVDTTTPVTWPPDKWLLPRGKKHLKNGH